MCTQFGKGCGSGGRMFKRPGEKKRCLIQMSFFLLLLLLLFDAFISDNIIEIFMIYSVVSLC